MAFDLIVRNASLPDGRTGQTIAVDAGGHLVSPPFVDPHFHMDATLTLGLARDDQRT